MYSVQSILYTFLGTAFWLTLDCHSGSLSLPSTCTIYTSFTLLNHIYCTLSKNHCITKAFLTQFILSCKLSPHSHSDIFYVDISWTSPWAGGMMEGHKAILDTGVLRKVLLVPKIPLLQSQGLYPIFQ